jgi:hypothetical protein
MSKETAEEMLKRLGRHPRDCPGGCNGDAYIKIPIPLEKRATICYDHWDKYNWIPCKRGKKLIKKIKRSRKRK